MGTDSLGLFLMNVRSLPDVSHLHLLLVALLNGAALALVYLILCLPGVVRSSSRLTVIGGALFLLLLNSGDDRRIFWWLPQLPLHWNWPGKLFELLLCIITLSLLIRFWGWNREQFGLKLSFLPGTAKAVIRFVFPLLLVELVALWYMIPAEIPRFEDHVFQLTAPGLTEELAFRGILLALLDKAFSGRVKILGADLGWGAVVTSLLFGLVHGLDIGTNFNVSLNLGPMVIPLLGGFVIAWCRARSGTLLLPILLHSGMNEVANLIALVKALR